MAGLTGLQKQPSKRKAPVYRPFPWQQVFHRTNARDKYVWAGRRAGKGRSAIQEVLSLIDKASQTPLIDAQGNDQTDTLEPEIHVWTVGPTNAQLRQVWNEMKAFIPPYMVRGSNPWQAGGRGRTGWKEDELYVWLELRGPSGNWLPGRVRRTVFWELKTADNPDALQTVGLDVLHVTEAQDVKESAWDKVRPTINSPGRLGRTIIEGIPPLSKAHWFSRRWWDAHRNPSQFAVAFKATTFDNTLLTQEQIGSILEEKRSTPEVIWNRMYLAEQPEGGGGFFRKINLAAHGTELPSPVEGRRYVAGLDLGKQIDPTVLIIKDRQTRESVYAIEMLKVDWQLQLPAIANECRRWGVELCYMDSTGMGGDVLYEELAVQGVPVMGYKFTTQDKYQLFLTYAVALENQTVGFPANWQKLKDQLDAMTVAQSGMGYIFRTIDGGHDDWVDAEALALKGCDPASSSVGSVLPNIGAVPPIQGSAIKKRRDPFFVKRRLAQLEKLNPPDLIENGVEVRL